MKKLLITILFLCLTVCPAIAKNKAKTVKEKQKDVFEKTEIITYKTFKINAVDPQNIVKDNNALIIYTPLFGKTTKTDEKSLEAVVVDNRVEKINQNNSYIPQNGYIISGHGKAKQFISDNLYAGCDIDIDFNKEQIKLVERTDNFLYEAKYRLDNMRKIAETADKKVIEVDKMNFYISCADELLYKTKKLVQFGDYERAPQMAQHSITYSDMALFFTLPYDKNEFKAIWVYPYQKNEKEIFDEIDGIVNRIDVDNIFVESFYNGMTVYPSNIAEKYGLPSQNRYYNTYDILKTWVKTANDMEKNVYVTFNTFNIGNPEKSMIENNVISLYPSWQNKTKKKATKKGDLYLDPANPDVHKFILELLKEVSEKYEISGINLSGVRYPEGDYGYTDYARTEFIKLYGVDPIKLSENDEKWVAYKHSKIAEFVNKVIEFQKENPKVEILINVYDDTLNVEDWNLNEQIALCPVLTSSDNDFAADFINRVAANMKTSKIYPIYMEPYQEEPVRKLFDQITVGRKNGANGIILYTIDYLNKSYLDALRLAIFNKPKEKQKHIYEKDTNKKVIK